MSYRTIRGLLLTSNRPIGHSSVITKLFILKSLQCFNRYSDYFANVILHWFWNIKRSDKFT